MTDYLIIGQGLAGSLLSHFLIKKGKTVAFVDNRHKGASSAIAAGIINPITGRHYVKSWKTDELLPVAFRTYEELSAIVGQQIFYPKNVTMLFRDAETANNWLARSAEPALEGYIAPNFDLENYRKYFGESVCAGVEFQKSGRCDMPGFIVAWKKYLKDHHYQYLEEAFDYNALEIGEESVVYKGISAKKLIFCEGAAAERNPFFSHLHYKPAKGEMLLVRIPGYNLNDKLAKDGIFIVPLDNELYWVGSSYNRDFEHSEPTELEYNNLVKELSEMLKIPFTVEQHFAAIRPTVRDRKPYLGPHPKFPLLFIFNGLGAKGSSLGPFYAEHFADYLEGVTALDKEVAISRLKPLK